MTATTSGDVVLVNVVLAGPTTSSDLYSLAFDLALSDPDVAHYVAGSATLGPALSLGAGQQGQALASQSQHRVTVGITKLGGGSGNGIGPTEEVLASFRFRVRKRGSTTIWLAGSSPDPPSALDSTGAKIDSVTFDAARASISGS